MENRNKYIESLKANCSITNKCWNWEGPIKRIDGASYGYFNNTLVHELMWMLYYPESQKGNFDRERYFLNHSCKNRLCINPKHLYLEENKNSRQIIKAKKKVMGERFFDPTNWQPPDKPEPKPSKFADWIFLCEIGKTKSPPWNIREEFKKKGKRDHVRLENILRKKWFEQDFLNKNEDWELFFSDRGDDKKNFSASKLLLNNKKLLCKPDVILYDKSNNQFIIIERKFTYVPLQRILIPKWSSAQGQLWCYSWIDELIKAKNVLLVLELYKPLINNPSKEEYLLPLETVFKWNRNDSTHHNKCLKMFRRYGGIFKE